MAERNGGAIWTGDKNTGFNGHVGGGLQVEALISGCAARITVGWGGWSDGDV